MNVEPLYIRLLVEGVVLGNSVVEGLLGEVACAVWRIEDLSRTWIRGVRDRDEWSALGELGDGDVRCGLVGLDRVVGGGLPLVASG